MASEHKDQINEKEIAAWEKVHQLEETLKKEPRIETKSGNTVFRVYYDGSFSSFITIQLLEDFRSFDMINFPCRRLEVIFNRIHVLSPISIDVRSRQKPHILYKCRYDGEGKGSFRDPRGFPFDLEDLTPQSKEFMRTVYFAEEMPERIDFTAAVERICDATLRILEEKNLLQSTLLY